jgi:hypothetical protein
MSGADVGHFGKRLKKESYWLQYGAIFNIFATKQ